MPLTITSKIDPLYTVSQLLSYLQLEGHLDNLEVPDWATGGTTVEELIEALRLLGNGEWLQEYKGGGVLEAADDWIMDLLKGKPVVTPDET